MVRSLAFVLSAALAAAAVAGDTREVPAGFQPLDAALKLDGRPSDFMLPDTIDLSWGMAMISCPSGPWRGTVRFVGHAGGDIEYTGDMYGCFTFGKGTARYGDGSTYSGSVNAYVAAGLDNFTRLTAEGVRVAVPEGVGSALQLGVAAREQAFVRGLPSVDPKDPRFSALDVAFVGLGREAVAASAWIVRYAANPGAAVEKGVANIERDAAGAERAALVAAAQAERLGTQVVTQGLAVSADAEAFARRAGNEAQGAGAMADRGGQQLGTGKQPAKKGGKASTGGVSLDGIGGALAGVGGAVQTNSNSTTGANAVTQLDTPQNDISGTLFARGSAPAAGAEAAARCIAGRWQRQACGGSAAVELSFSGGERGTGHRAEGACPVNCPQGGRIEFRYTLTSDGTVQVEYAGGPSCGRTVPASQEQQMLSCAGDALRMGDDYRRVAR